jgi:F-type H+-transporting ATPase subunit delta
MKNIGRLANVYAKSLLTAMGGKDGDVEAIRRVSDELQEFSKLWQTNKQLVFFMLNPACSKQERINALLKIAETAGMGATSQNFLKVVFERNRIAGITQIIAEYRALVEKHTGLTRIKIETAREVDADERHEYEEKLRSKISGHLIFEWSVKQELLGGMIIKYSGKVFDGSIKGQFEKLEEKILGY